MNKLLLCLIITSLAPPCRAAQIEAIGAVFYSPAERAALIDTRTGITQSVVYTVNGIVQRGAKKSAAWINGRAVLEEHYDAAIPTLLIGRDHVMIEDKPIKVGETLDILSGQRGLRLPEDAVRVKP